jgi:hypothetical protein
MGVGSVVVVSATVTGVVLVDGFGTTVVRVVEADAGGAVVEDCATSPDAQADARMTRANDTTNVSRNRASSSDKTSIVPADPANSSRA